MEAWMAFVSIMAILAIVLVGGGLIAFIAHLIIGAFDKEPRVDVEPAKTGMLDYSEYKQAETEPSTKTLEEYDFEAINKAKADKEKDLAEDEDLDMFDLAEEETEEKVEKVEEELVEELVEEEDEDFDVDSILDEISNDIIEEEKEKSTEENAPKMSSELESYSIEEYLNSVEETEDAEEVEESVKEETEEVDELEDIVEEVLAEDEESEDGEDDSAMEIKPEFVEEVEEVEEPVEEVQEEKEDESKKVIEELKAQLADLNRQLAEARSATKTEVVTINMTEEECVARLEMLEERLKSVKKDYKTNMKEYRPLKKVMNDLEKYQQKLRRKDTMVAKKKVALYGVNNYVDIDKEKAEKLANDLELLDGLRLSVSHCEEVINANKDRFPILERTNQILEDQIAHIEADIASTQATLAKIREENGGNN